VVALSGAITLAYAAAYTASHGVAGGYAKGFAVVSVFLILSEARPMSFLRRHAGTDVTISWSFAFALVLLSPAAGVIAIGFASAFGDLLRRTAPARLAFNAAQLVLSLGAAWFVLAHANGGVVIVGDGVSVVDALVVLAAAVVAFGVNIVLTGVAIALDEGCRVWPVIRSGAAANLPTDGMLLALAPVFAVTAARTPVLLPLLVIVVWNVYCAAQLALARQHEATHDALTDLANRRRFFDEVQHAHNRAHREGYAFAIAVLDLDGFKTINDQLGHLVGDGVLEEVAARLRRACRTIDVAGRLGGDEFAVLLGHVEDVASARAAIRAIERELECPLTVAGVPLKVGVSSGLAVYPNDGDDVDGLLQHADETMYETKIARRPIELRKPPRSGQSRLLMLGELEHAIEHDELVLYYQPKVDLASGEVVGVEALVRWAHPRLGLVLPGEFLSLAEQTELMEPLTTHVLGEALRQCAQWRSRGWDLTVAVNVCARDLQDPRFPGTVRSLVTAQGGDPSMLELELTESALLADRARAAGALESLRAIGVTFAIDDFGTGHSSLANLRELPVDRIKIDRSFVSTIAERPADEIIVASTIELTHKLGLTCIAEGVEDARILQRLTEFGCDMAQGYWIGRPIPGPQIAAWVAQRTNQPRAVAESATADLAIVR
jgi:diguanylate cyclase (GGDEF)-like protein